MNYYESSSICYLILLFYSFFLYQETLHCNFISLFTTYWDSYISNKLHVVGFVSLSEDFQVLVFIEYFIYLFQGLPKCTE